VDHCLSFGSFLAIVFSVLRFMDYDYSFGIFKLYLAKKKYQQTKKLNKNDEITLETKRADTHHLTGPEFQMPYAWPF